MIRERKSLFAFLGALVLCILCATLAYFWNTPRNQFQQKTVPSPILDYGETGSILRELGAILPVENKQWTSRITTNPVEFIRRASDEKKKWLFLEEFSAYREKGIFGYVEMDSPESAVPFKIEVKKNGSWVKQVSSQIRPSKFGYAFFIDSNKITSELRFVFRNKQSSIQLYGIGFLKKGYHPLVFNDGIGFASLFRDNTSNNISFGNPGIAIAPSPHVNLLTATLSFQKKRLIGISKYHKKQGNTSIELVASRDQHLLKHLKIADQDLASISIAQIPVLSIDIESEDLYSDDFGILTNFDGHGRQWERLGFVRYFRDGEEVFSNFSGIRLQGGDPGREKGLINFRLYFREEYGKSAIEPGRFFNGKSGEIKQLSVKQSEWEKWPLNSPISYDVSRQVGALVPPTEMCLLYLNGENIGLYYLVPHLGEKQIKLMLPEDDYRLYKIRGAGDDADLHFSVSFSQKIKQAQVMDAQHISKFFDLEEYVKLIFSYMINANGDYCQGLLVKGSKSESKYFWYGWDFDHSYVDVPVEITKREIPYRDRWEQPPSFAKFLSDEQGRKTNTCEPVNLFRRLVNEDQEFREKTKHLFTSTINHRVTEQFISELLDDYQHVLTRVDYPEGDEYIDVLRSFFVGRIPFLIKEMEEYYPAEPAAVCLVTSDVYPLTVDGYRKTGPYQGYYFSGATLTLAPDKKNEVKYWLVNGEKIYDKQVELLITNDQNCRVHAVF